MGFKPYYNWNTFNTQLLLQIQILIFVVLNLIITGIPSILIKEGDLICQQESFKPYYNWNTFNTFHLRKLFLFVHQARFKPYYNWNTFNTEDNDGEPSVVAKF